MTILCLLRHTCPSLFLIQEYLVTSCYSEGLRRNQHLSYLLVPLSPREEGENTEPLISNIPLLGSLLQEF